ncbi:outer membrane insertion C- signal [Echinicola strongylocentroti]|uniref:Outer membrane insertion C-signal n=1 Tax=Echinicola strongylocentroti TaxID=1795355 RepID=A0A2Z4IQW2_9BACT|nr:YaiO family outer membrane beta-barrel protein [Echinicola strongylocentroti]AWW32946.1 outer membrane insertion C- signal [Echinicola strongylocentroti]
MKTKVFILHIICSLAIMNVHGQTSFDPDKKFLEARQLAFDGKRDEAIELGLKIVEKYPGYSDVWILLGRVNAWEGKYDTASVYFEKAIEISPDYEDAYNGYLDNLFWAEQYDQAEEVLQRAEEQFGKSSSSALTYRKSRLHYYREEYEEALEIADKLYENEADIEGLLSYINNLRRFTRNSAVGLTVDYDSFQGEISPWQTYALYARTRLGFMGSVIARATHSHRFDGYGTQYELDAYPSLGKNSYAYVNVGFSNASFFPDYRFGTSIYWSLPKAFEFDIGYRHLKFSEITHILTASVGKYTGNWWLNLRANHVPSSSGGSISGNVQARYYFKGAEDYLMVQFSTGVSPDEEDRDLQSQLLDSYRGRVGYQQLWTPRWMGYAFLGYSYDELSPGNYRPNLNISFGTEFRF